MQAVVYKSTGSWYTVKTSGEKFYQARIKGVFRIDEEISSTNPISVGDEVTIQVENELENSAIITAIAERKNYISRQSPRAKHQQHIVAANVDQSILLVTLKEPRTATGFIDRYLIACEMYHIRPIIIYNKADIYRQKDLEAFEEIKQIYTAIGYTVLLISVANHLNTELLKEIIINKTTLISGPSGVGKSSLFNVLLPGKQQRTQEISGWSGKGMHTTTFAEMFDLPFGGQIIDTPGMKEFGLLDVSRQELSHYFIEMKQYLPQCRFNNCMHLSEPECGVKKAVINKLISEERYLSYCHILDSIEAETY